MPGTPYLGPGPTDAVDLADKGYVDSVAGTGTAIADLPALVGATAPTDLLIHSRAGVTSKITLAQLESESIALQAGVKMAASLH